jgi:DNA-binding beta-propeller fold protein YncE
VRETLLPRLGILYVSDEAAARLVPFSIDRHQLLKRIDGEVDSVSVGQQPGNSIASPNGDMMLVADQASNDVAIIRILPDGPPFSRLITLIPVGQRPRDIAVKMF